MAGFRCGSLARFHGGCGRLFLVGHGGGLVCGVFIVVDILFYCVER